MNYRRKLVCEADGDCQEDAVVTVSVWRISPRQPVTVARLCAWHGDRWIRVNRDLRIYDLQVDQGVQQEMAFG